MKIGQYSNISPDVYISPNVTLEIGDMTTIGSGVRIIGNGTVKFGDYCKIHNSCFINSGNNTLGIVEFGHNCWIGERAVLDGIGGIHGMNNIGIGIASHLYTHIAHGDIIEGCRFHNTKKMIIEDDVWFVGQCLISPIHAKYKSMAMLGSTITKNMETNHVYAGTPAVDITNKIGNPWITRTNEEKFKLLKSTIEKYFCERDDKNHELIEPCYDLPEIRNRKPNVTYISVNSRKYTKLLTKIERDFMSWLISYKGRYIPELNKSICIL